MLWAVSREFPVVGSSLSPLALCPILHASMAASSSYWQASRAPRYSLLFALPLLVAYELLAAALAREAEVAVRNGADVLLKTAFLAIAGEYGPAVFGAALIGGSLWFVGRDWKARGAPTRAAIFAGMAAESLALALVTGVVVGVATAQLLTGLGVAAADATGVPGGALAVLSAGTTLPQGRLTGLMLSLGAGLYEELLFRVLLVTGLAALARRTFALRPLPAGVFAASLGALLFSAFHYIGPYGDPFELQSFTFRALAGLYFSALYLLRGFGITAWTHALYDVFILVF